MTQSVFNWGPLVALALIALIGSATVHCQVNTRERSLLYDALFILWVMDVVTVLYSFFCSIYIGPGFVPKKWVRGGERGGEREREVERERWKEVETSLHTLTRAQHALSTHTHTLSTQAPKNKSDAQFLLFCRSCKGYKAPRSHHCSQWYVIRFS